MYRRIKLTQGKYALIDHEDFELVSRFKWYFSSLGYVSRSGCKKHFTLHQLIMKTKKGEYVDHVNRNKLDNRKENLRIVTNQQNSFNRIKSKNNKTGYKGVTYNKNANKFMSYINLNYKQIYLGLFNDKKEAAQSYNIAAIKYHGKFARINKL